MKRFIVIGLGNFGSATAESLHAEGHEVIGIDTNEVSVDRLASRLTKALVADGRDAGVFRTLGIEGADAGVVSTGDDITASVLATLALKDLGVPEIYAKVVSPDHARVMERMDVTETIFPERESGIRLAKRMSNRKIINHVSLGDGLFVQEMAVPRWWVGRSLRDINAPENFRVSIIAVHDAAGVMHPIPDGDRALRTDDTLVVAAMQGALERITESDEG
jgi:trk system potassium uptake protein